MLGLGQKIPEFRLFSTLGRPLDSKELLGSWSVLFFFPKAKTVVCQSEVLEFNSQLRKFDGMKTKVFGISTDDMLVQKEWATELGISYPLLADTDRKISAAFGVINPEKGSAFRALFIADKELVIRHITANINPVGRSVQETLRVLSALQTGKSTLCEWHPGQATL